MNTPEWFGSIGVMNSAHMHRRGMIARVRLAISELRAAAAGMRFRSVAGWSSSRAGRWASRRNRHVLTQNARTF